jgi:hypothetical protein
MVITSSPSKRQTYRSDNYSDTEDLGGDTARVALDRSELRKERREAVDRCAVLVASSRDPDVALGSRMKSGSGVRKQESAASQ